jgi:hypothetical protein
VQRTRSSPSALRSPLTRHPLGRVIVICGLALAAFRCGSEADWTGVNVSASEEWLGATVTIDTHQVGKLEHLMLHDTLPEKVLKKQFGDSPMFHMVALNVPVNASTSGHGVHRVRIEKHSSAVEGEFTFPDPRGSRIQFLSISGQTLVNNPGPDAYGSHP